MPDDKLELVDAELRVGGFVWVFDSNYRVYREGESSFPIYEKHFRKATITAERPKTWVLSNGCTMPKAGGIGTRPLTIPRDGARVRNVAYLSVRAIKQDVWVHTNRPRLVQAVSNCDDYIKLRRVAAELGLSLGEEL